MALLFALMRHEDLLPASPPMALGPRAFQVDPLAGTFAGIALRLNGLLTALLVPLLLPRLLD
jgi:hypothetical protein